MMVVARSILFVTAFYASTVLILVVLTPASFILSRSGCIRAARLWARYSLWLLKTVCKTEIEFRGLENLPDRPFILAMKHQSMLETIALLTVLKQPAYIMKRELQFVPLWGWLAWRAGAIYVTRGRRARAISQIERGTRVALASGQTVVIAPEGARRPPGAPPAYKYGIAHLYEQFAVPVAPLALNSGLYWPRASPVRSPGTIVLSFLKPINPGLSPEAFIRELTEVVEAECDRLLIEAADSARTPRFGPDATARLQTIRRGGS